MNNDASNPPLGSRGHDSQGDETKPADPIDSHSEDSDTLSPFEVLLAKYDQAVESKSEDVIGSVMQQFAELGLVEEFERARECIELIDEVWPGAQETTSAEQSTASGISFHDAYPDSNSGADQRPSTETVQTLGRFRIRRELGRGGGGIVYLATDTRLRRDVALKVPHPSFLLSEDLRKRFIAEARLAASIHHPHVVPVYEIGEVGPICFIAAAYCDGPSLAAWLSSVISNLPQRKVAQFILLLAETVGFAHRSNILHRDLKPGNILLEPVCDEKKTAEAIGPHQLISRDLDDYTLKLTDFGLAKMLNGDSHPTRSGAILGTAEYMSPEQASGRLDEVGPTTEIYAIGVILYEMLTRTSPFRMPTEVETIHRIVFEEAAMPSKLRKGLDRDLEAICLKCMEKAQRDRYGSAEELSQDLKRYVDGTRTLARPIPTRKRFVKWTRRRPAIIGLAVAAVLLVAAVGLTLRYRHEVQRNEIGAKRHEYVKNINKAYMDWKNGRVTSSLEALQQCRPGAGEEDQRGFEWFYINRLCEGGLSQSVGHQARAIHGVCFSSDGQKLATCGDDGTIHVWRTATGRLLHQFAAKSSRLSGIQYSPDGKYLATVADDRGLDVWDAETQDFVGNYRADSREPCCFAFSRNGLVAVAGAGGRITLWKLGAASKKLTSIDTDCDRIHGLDFARDGRLAAACSDETAKIWDPHAAESPIRVLDDETSAQILSVDFSPDGRYLVTGGGFVHLWPLDEDLRPTWLNAIAGDFVAFSGDGNYVASSGRTESVFVWNLTTSSREHIYRMHQRHVLGIAFGLEGHTLASVDRGGVLGLWDASLPQERRPVSVPKTSDDPAAFVQFSPTSNNTLAISPRRPFLVSTWRVRLDGEADMTQSYTHTENIDSHGMAYSWDGSMLAVMGMKGRLLLDASLNPIADKKLGPPVASSTKVAFSKLGYVAQSPSGATGQLSVSKLDTGRQVALLDGFRGIDFSPDGRLLAMESGSFDVELWDVVSRKTVGAMTGHDGHIYDVDFSNDGTLLASCSADGTVRVWDVVNRQEMKSLHGHSEGIHHVSFSPNQRCVVSAGTDGALVFWDIATGRPMLKLEMDSRIYQGFSFSADGQILATSSYRRSAPVKNRVDLWLAPRVSGTTAQ